MQHIKTTNLLVSEKRFELGLALSDAFKIGAINEEHDSVHSREVILPHTTC